MSTSTILFIIALASAIVAYIANVQDSKQKDRIEELGKINKSLSEKIDTLSQINNSIAINNTNLSKDNIALAKKANDLITEVEKLTSSSKKLIGKVDVRTEKQYAENALSGKLELKFNKPLRNGDKIVRQFGSSDDSFTIKGIVEYPIKYIAFSPLIQVGHTDPLDFRIIDGKLVISLTVYDLFGNWVADIQNNYWRRNPNYVGKFNYDDKGLYLFYNPYKVSTESTGLSFYGVTPY